MSVLKRILTSKEARFIKSFDQDRRESKLQNLSIRIMMSQTRLITYFNMRATQLEDTMMTVL